MSDWLVKKHGQYIGRSLFRRLHPVSDLRPDAGGRQGDTIPMSPSLILALAAGALYLGQATYWAVGADFGGPYSGIVSGLLNMGGQIAGAVTASATPWFAREVWLVDGFLCRGGRGVRLRFPVVPREPR